MTASNELICFPAWSFPETAMGCLCICLKGSITRPPVSAVASQKKKKKRCIPWLSCSLSERHVLQYRCQPRLTRRVRELRCSSSTVVSQIACKYHVFMQYACTIYLVLLVSSGTYAIIPGTRCMLYFYFSCQHFKSALDLLYKAL